jgi:hypothetical protein
MPKNETISVRRVLFSYETFDALPERKINSLSILPDYE